MICQQMCMKTARVSPAAISGLRMDAAVVGPHLGRDPQPTVNARMIIRWMPGSILVGLQEERQSIPHRVHAIMMNHMLAQ